MGPRVEAAMWEEAANPEVAEKVVEVVEMAVAAVAEETL
jgi:hypothetical protein